MKTLPNTFFVLALLLLASNVSGLPDCKNSVYDHCFSVVINNGDKYVGEFENGQKHGQGTETNADGDKYVGAFENGKEHGQGVFSQVNGDKYVGMFSNGEYLHKKSVEK